MADEEKIDELTPEPQPEAVPQAEAEPTAGAEAEAPGTETAPEEVTEEEVSGEEEAPAPEPEPKRHRFAEKLSKAYPDRKFEKPEDFDAGLDEYLGELEEYRERGQMANQKLISVFESEPAVGDLVRDIMNGATVREALARNFSPDDLVPEEGDPDYEGWNKRKTEREENLRKQRERQEEYNKNLEFSTQAIETFAQENNMDEDAASKFLQRMDAMLADINQGKISKEFLLTLKKAWNYDNDLAKAKEAGTVAGRNASIIAKKEAEKPVGDGIPKVANTSEIPEGQKAKPDYLGSLVDRVTSRDVWRQ